MKSKLILTSSEVEDLAVCVDCAFQECMDCPRNKAKQKLKEAARDKGEVSNGITPIADAVPVVRCRECEYAFKSGSSITGIRCEVWGTYDLFHACEPDWFCSHGKRKEGTSNGIYK